MDVISKYFHDLTDTQIEQYRQLYDLYADWNAKINVISRKDIENLYTNHVLHSLAIAKFTDFKPESAVLDVGTGGGFPGIPLAIMFPETHFLLIDRTGKKVKVAQAVAQSIGLQNVECRQCDVAEVKSDSTLSFPAPSWNCRHWLPSLEKYQNKVHQQHPQWIDMLERRRFDRRAATRKSRNDCRQSESLF